MRIKEDSRSESEIEKDSRSEIEKVSESESVIEKDIEGEMRKKVTARKRETVHEQDV